MYHTLRAQHGPGTATGRGEARASLGPVVRWHVVREAGTRALCGSELGPESRTLPEDSWGSTAEPMCHLCSAYYLRESPYTPEPGPAA